MSDFTSNGSMIALKVELERIEALLARARAAATSAGILGGDVTGPAGANVLTQIQALAGGGNQLVGVDNLGNVQVGVVFAGPIVANEAAMRALVMLDGEQVFVLSHRSIWTKRNGVAGTQGVPPLFPHEVDPADDLSGVFCRTNYSDPALRTGINDVYIDPANGAADDENDGLTPLTPLATGYELFRRWGWGASKPIVGPNLATSPDGFTTIHIMSDIVSPDTLEVRITVAINGSIRLRGGTPTTIRAGTLTAASVAMNALVPLGGTRLRLTDAAVVSWVPDMVANRRGRITTGAQAGATFQPQTNVGGGVVDCSAAQTVDEPGFSQSPTTVTPAAGSAYVIESLVQCNFSAFEITQEQNPNFGGFNSFINFVDLNFPAIGTNNLSWEPITSLGTFSQPFFNFYQCTFDRNVDFTSCASVQAIASYYFNMIIFNYCTGGIQAINGGGMNSIAPGVSGVTWGALSNTSLLDFNFVANRSLIFLIGNSVGGLFASWNALALAGINTAGHGVIVGTRSFAGMRGEVTFARTVWGNSNAGAGLLIGANCNGTGAPQNITGVQSDFKLGNKILGWWFNDVTAAYAPVGAAGVPTTWAALLAGEGAAGFGGNAHELDSNAHYVAAETTA